MSEYAAIRGQKFQQYGGSVAPRGGNRLQLGAHRGICGAPDDAGLDRFAAQCRLDVQVGGAFEVLGDSMRSDCKVAALTIHAVAHISQPVVVSRDGDGHVAVAVGNRIGSVTGVIVKGHMRTESGCYRDGPRTSRIVIQPDQQTRTAEPLVSENVEVLPSLLSGAGREFLMNPDQVIDLRFQFVTVGAHIVVTIVDTGIAFRSQDVGIAKNLVENHIVAGVQVGIVVFDEGYGARWRDPNQPNMVKIGHVKASGVVTHGIENKLQWEIEGAGAAIHPRRVKYPAVHQHPIAVKEFAHGEFTRHRPGFQKRAEKVRREALDIVNAVALHIQSPGQPVRGGNEIVNNVMMREPVDRGQFPSEGSVILYRTSQVWISMNLRDEI